VLLLGCPGQQSSYLNHLCSWKHRCATMSSVFVELAGEGLTELFAQVGLEP
jgi:hypothetical protein